LPYYSLRLSEICISRRRASGSPFTMKVPSSSVPTAPTISSARNSACIRPLPYDRPASRLGQLVLAGLLHQPGVHQLAAAGAGTGHADPQTPRHHHRVDLLVGARALGDDLQDRSEERRVGKEGRARWTPGREKKTNNLPYIKSHDGSGHADWIQ